MNKQISFQSKIQFVNRKEFDKIIRRNYLFSDNIDPCSMNEALYSTRFITEKIRTCTAGGLVAPYKDSFGFHIFHDESSHKRLDDMFAEMFLFMQPERALIVGSKNVKSNECNYSIKNFAKIKDILKKRVKHLTFFQQHRKYSSETSLYYNQKEDTWVIFCVYDQKNKNYDVVNLQNLLTAYKHIQIAEGDSLFIDGKEILPKDCQRIFVKNWKPHQEKESLLKKIIVRVERLKSKLCKKSPES